MAFRIQRARGTISGQPSVSPGRHAPSTSGAVGQAVAHAGSVLHTLGEKWDLQEADTQFTKSKAQARQEHNQFLLSLEGMEPADYDKAYDASIQKRGAFIPKNPKAAREYKNWLTTLDPFWVKDKDEYMKAKLNDDGRAAGFVLQQEAIETGRMDEYLIHLAKGTKLGYYKKEEAAKLKQATVDKRDTYIRLQKAEQKEQLELQREVDRDKIGKMIRSGDDASAVIEGSLLDEAEQTRMFEYQRLETDRRLSGKYIITNQSKKHELLDMAAATNWPDQQTTQSEVKQLAYEARYGVNPTIDDAAYGEIRDALRKAEKDELPFTPKFIEETIGELTTGAPSSVFGIPLPVLRTREEHIRYATNRLGRFLNRTPGVMDVINAKFPPEKTKVVPAEKDATPAYDFDGEQIGYYNTNGTITLSEVGLARILEIAGGDEKKAREIIIQNRYVIPP